MRIFDLFRYTHVAAGCAALVLFWLAAAMRKGSVPHRRIGRWYLLSMVGVIVTALPLSAAAFGRKQLVLGTFLLYLVLITGTAAWTAWRAIRDQRDVARFAGAGYRALGVVNILAGAAVLAFGVRFEVLILSVFSAVGLIGGVSMLRFAARGPHHPRWWLAQHYGSIIGCGVATHIAFLNLGAQRLIPENWGAAASTIGWFAPLAVALIARVWLARRYRMPTLVDAMVAKPRRSAGRAGAAA